MAALPGSVTICCPVCRRDTAFPIAASGPQYDDDGRLVLRLTLDMFAVRAHMLTHGPHGGEPLAEVA